MRLQNIFLLILTLALVFVSCNKDETFDAPEQDLETPYFPLAVGNWIAYQIEDINIDKESAVNDTVSYQIKELIESVTHQSDVYTDYRLERYVRKDASVDWKILNVWQIRKYQRRIHKVEDNVDYVRLVMPAEVHEVWDANAFNVYEEKECEIKSIEETSVLESARNVLRVSYSDSESLIDKNLEDEQYAENLGLISKTKIDVRLNIDPNKPWQDKVIKGTIYRQTIIDYKK